MQQSIFISDGPTRVSCKNVFLFLLEIVAGDPRGLRMRVSGLWRNSLQFLITSQPRRTVMWRETKLATSPFYLSARHKHQRSRVVNHWPLSEHTQHANCCLRGTGSWRSIKIWKDEVRQITQRMITLHCCPRKKCHKSKATVVLPQGNIN
jgi:hypothetical protein